MTPTPKLYGRTIELALGETIDVQRASVRDPSRTPSGGNLCFDHNQLSKFHATLTNDDGVLKIKDTDSSFGTFVNNQYLLQDSYYPVSNGSIVSFIMVKSFEEIRKITSGLTRSHEPIMLKDFGSPKLLLNFGISIQNKNKSLIVEFTPLGKMSKGSKKSQMKDDVTVIDVLQDSADDVSYNDNDSNIDAYDSDADDADVIIGNGSESDADLSNSDDEPILVAKLKLDNDFEVQRENAMVSYHQDNHKTCDESFGQFTDESAEEDNESDFDNECCEKPVFTVVDLMTKEFAEDEEDDDDDFDASINSQDVFTFSGVSKVTDDELDDDLSDEDDYAYRQNEDEELDDDDISFSSDNSGVDEFVVSLLSKPKKSLAEARALWEIERENAWIEYINNLDNEVLDVETEDDFEDDHTRLVENDADLGDFYSKEYTEDTDDEDYTDDTVYYTLNACSDDQHPSSFSSKLISVSKTVTKEVAKAALYGIGAIIALGAYSSLSKN